MNNSNFVAARAITFQNYYTGERVTNRIDSFEFELSNSREVSANFVKLGDIKQKTLDHGLLGSSLGTNIVYLVYPLVSVKRVFGRDCGSRLLEDGTLKGRMLPLEEDQFVVRYEEETAGYLECHVSKERGVPTVVIVVHEENRFTLEMVTEVKSRFPHLTVVVL